MSKAVITLDEINLLKNSEEPKNMELYGNLYDVLCNLPKPKALSLEDMPSLDERGRAALTYNKTTLFSTIVKEWYAENVSEEDPTKRVHCGLCNAPNRYLFYIRNRLNGTLLNVGSQCITKFPNIEGYIEQKEQLKQIQKGQRVISRRNEFYNHFGDVGQIIFNAEKYFTELPILLPINLYEGMQEAISEMETNYKKYVNDGRTQVNGKFNALELFQLALDRYCSLKEQADTVVKNNANKALICKRGEIEWLISNGKDETLRQIAKNNGFYTLETLRQMYSVDFVKDNNDILFSNNNSPAFKFNKVNDNDVIVLFHEFGYQNDLIFKIKLSDFMNRVGANCIIDPKYKYGSKEILDIAKIIDNRQNLSTVINYTFDIVRKSNCAFLIDDTTNSLYLYRKSDGAIRNFLSANFLTAFSRHVLESDKEINKFVTRLVIGKTITNWISKDMQAKQGISGKIRKLYKEQILADQI